MTSATLGVLAGAGVVGHFSPNAGMAGKLAGMAVGGATGYAIGQEVANYNLGPEDQRTRKASLFMALNEKPLNRPTDWHSKNNKQTNGTIVPTNQYMNDLGQVCRTYTEIVNSEAGRTETEQVACKYPGGTWVVE